MISIAFKIYFCSVWMSLFLKNLTLRSLKTNSILCRMILTEFLNFWKITKNVGHTNDNPNKLYKVEHQLGRLIKCIFIPLFTQKDDYLLLIRWKKDVTVFLKQISISETSKTAGFSPFHWIQEKLEPKLVHEFNT